MPKKRTINGYQYYHRQIRMPDGKRKNLYASTPRELDAKERDLRRELEALKNLPTTPPTVAAYATKQLSLMQSKISPATYAGYEAKVRLHIIPLLGNKLLTDVRVDDIREVMAAAEHLSASHYRLLYTLLNQIFAAAVENDLISKNPVDKVASRGGQKQVERSALTDEQANQLLDAVQGLPAETFCRLGLYAGLRREEALALKWQHVYLDIDTPYIEVENAWRIEHNRPIISSTLKTPAARRKIPIPPTLSVHLQQIREKSKSDYVIHNSQNGPLSGTQWRHLWDQVTRRTTVQRKYRRYVNGKMTVHTVTPQCGKSASHNPTVKYTLNFSTSPHRLRHTYITNLIYSGCDPKTVQYLAGHQHSRTTMDIYAKIKYNRPEDNFAVVCRAFASKSPPISNDIKNDIN